MKLIHGEYYHNYDIYFYDFYNKIGCLDTKILIGSKEVTYDRLETHNNIIFPHLQADLNGCDKPTDTNT